MSRLIHFVTALLILGKYVPTIISPFDFDRKSELQSGILTCMLGGRSGLGNISVIRVPLKASNGYPFRDERKQVVIQCNEQPEIS